MSQLTNAEKAELYDSYVRQSEVYLRENSKIKSEFAGNIPEDKQAIIDSNTKKVNELEIKLKALF